MSNAVLWRRCEFCLAQFTIERRRMTDRSSGAHRRGVYCSEQCRRKGMWLQPVTKEKVNAILKDRAALRRIVRERGLDKRPGPNSNGDLAG